MTNKTCRNMDLKSSIRKENEIFLKLRLNRRRDLRIKTIRDCKNISSIEQ